VFGFLELSLFLVQAVLVLRHRRFVFTAMTDANLLLPTGRPVKLTGAIDSGTVLVYSCPHTTRMVWNLLPDHLHDPSLSIGSFRLALKTFLFTMHRDT